MLSRKGQSAARCRQTIADFEAHFQARLRQNASKFIGETNIRSRRNRRGEDLLARSTPSQRVMSFDDYRQRSLVDSQVSRNLHELLDAVPRSARCHEVPRTLLGTKRATTGSFICSVVAPRIKQRARQQNERTQRKLQ